MQFEVDHLTRYRYSVPVSLGEHQLRFAPAWRPSQQLLDCEVETTPAPVTLHDGVDTWGNPVRSVTFEGTTTLFEIRARLRVETMPVAAWPAPGQILIPPHYTDAPFDLTPFLVPLEEPGALWTFIEPLQHQAGGDAAVFLAALNAAIHGFYHRGVRLAGEARRPSETLARGEGVCRDLTLLFMAVCRQVGIAARFVSGYQQGDGTRELRYLHAWPEVYLPGEGWVGYDPTHGDLAGGDHLAVAAAPSAQAVTPVEGGYSFVGSQVDSTLETEIRITTR